jgi:UDP:flavonoid glycosyltransferase YjiC (YdhE family)
MTHGTTTIDRSARRPRVLFVGEAVSLAHVARPFTLARALHAEQYDVHLACDPRFNQLLGPLPFPHHPITTISCDRFREALARGQPIYDTQTLRDYVAEDRKLLAAVSPDFVVGDFRLSLSVSARLAGIPYATITNAYWSPYARLRFPLPDLPITRLLGVRLATLLFRLVRPLAFAWHCRPLNRVRQEHGLPSLGSDLRRIYTDADYTLYADSPGLVPMNPLPPNHLFLGPVLWSPTVDRPAWWDELPSDQPIVYVTLGSSGRSDVLEVVLNALADQPVTVIAATAGRTHVTHVPANAYVAEYLPGEEAAARAAVVICNGGSPTTQQALAAGKPVIGIASNMDQYLNMEAIQRTGAGVLLRASHADGATLRSILERIIKPLASRPVVDSPSTTVTHGGRMIQFSDIAKLCSS